MDEPLEESDGDNACRYYGTHVCLEDRGWRGDERPNIRIQAQSTQPK